MSDNSVEFEQPLRLYPTSSPRQHSSVLPPPPPPPAVTAAVRAVVWQSVHTVAWLWPVEQNHCRITATASNKHRPPPRNVHQSQCFGFQALCWGIWKTKIIVKLHRHHSVAYYQLEAPQIGKLRKETNQVLLMCFHKGPLLNEIGKHWL